MRILDFFKKTEYINKKRILKIGSFSVVLPSGWILDTSHKEVLALYRKYGDSGSIQISVFSKGENKKNNPQKVLRKFLKDKKIKIKKLYRNNSNYAISDYYTGEGYFSRAMVVDNPKKHAFITYNIEEKFKNAYLREVDEIFDSFLFN